MKFRLTAVAAVATLALLGTACGSDDSSDSSGGSDDRSAQNDVLVQMLMKGPGGDMLDEECVRGKIESLSDEDAAQANQPGGALSEEGATTLASVISECTAG
jgi:hypothetical protein